LLVRPSFGGCDDDAGVADFGRGALAAGLLLAGRGTRADASGAAVSGDVSSISNHSACTGIVSRRDGSGETPTGGCAVPESVVGSSQSSSTSMVGWAGRGGDTTREAAAGRCDATGRCDAAGRFDAEGRGAAPGRGGAAGPFGAEGGFEGMKRG
jgi:hypothetical protein